MKEVIKRYEDTMAEFKAKRKVAEEKRNKKFDRMNQLEAKLERAKAAAQKADEAMYAIHCPSLYENIVEPLAKKLAEHFGMEYEIYGPFGMECIAVAICFLSLAHYTKEKIGQYKKNKFGYEQPPPPHTAHVRFNRKQTSYNPQYVIEKAQDSAHCNAPDYKPPYIICKNKHYLFLPNSPRLGDAFSFM